MAFRRSIPLMLLAAAGCGVDKDAVPEGKLAVVGEVVIGIEDLAELRGQLGAYAQRRFGGSEGLVSLLDATIDAELLAQEADRAGLGGDPSIRWAILEELATLQSNAELERRVPRSSVAADEPAVLRYYEEHAHAFEVPERRSAKGVLFLSFDEAEDAHRRLSTGEVDLETLGPVFVTEPTARDEQEYPAFHPLLFDGRLRAGDVLPAPVLLGDQILVGRLEAVEPARTRPLEDPEVREAVVTAIHAARLQRARAELLAELAHRFPERPVSATDAP